MEIMKKLFKQISKKHNDTGESMAEVLVAALIVELALIGAVSMIIASGHMIKKAQDNFDRNFRVSNTVAMGGVSSSDDRLVEIDTDKSATISLNGVSINVEVSKVVGLDENDSSAESGKPVFFFKKR